MPWVGVGDIGGVAVVRGAVVRGRVGDLLERAGHGIGSRIGRIRGASGAH